MTPKRPPIVLWIVVAVVALAAIVAVVVSISGDDKESVVADQVIAPVDGTDLEGAPLRIDTTDGRPKVIIGVAHWCPHCQAEVPRLVEHFADQGLPEDVDVLAVSTAIDPSAPNHPAKAWLDREGWTVPTIDDFDGSVATDLGIKGFPYFLVLDDAGKVVHRTSGELTTDEFDALVAAARTGNAPG